MADTTQKKLAVVRKWGSEASTPPAIDQAMAEQDMGYQRAFGPGRPINPFDGYSGTPRKWDYQTGYNITSRPLRDGRISFATLKGIIDSWDVARICIGHRIDDVRSLDWAIEAAPNVTEDVSTAIDFAKAKLRRPGGPGTRRPFRAWLAAYMEDVLRYDAGTLYRVRDRLGRVCGLKVVSGRTIAPQLDYYGDEPTPPAPAYVQYAQGVPWMWFTTDDLIYVPFRSQSDSPYGFAPLESVLMTANTDLRMQAFFLQHFTAGTVPEGFATVPEDLSSPQQIDEWQTAWDALLYGDQEAKHQIKWVPYGTKFEWPKDHKFDRDFQLFMIGKVAAAYHVTLNDLGFTDDVNRATGETQTEVQFRVGTLPLVQHIEDILTSYLQDDLGLPVVFHFDTGQEKDDRLAEAQTHRVYCDMGAESPDEVRERILGLPIDTQRPVGRYVMHSRRGPIPLVNIVSAQGDIDGETYGPSARQPALPDVPHSVPGVLPDTFTVDDKTSTAAMDQAQIAARQALHPDAGIAPVTPRIEEETAPAPAPAPAPGPVLKELTAGITVDTGITGYDLAGAPSPEAADFARKVMDHYTSTQGITKAATVAGLAVKAADTGRVLMLQRALIGNDNDPAKGTWEFPGGHLEEGEEPLTGACREWAEEVGCPPPPGALAGTWTTTNGIYRGHVWVIPNETDLTLNLDPDDRAWTNPDDPDGDAVETVAWFHPADLPGMPALRRELAESVDDWHHVVAGASLPAADVVRKELAAWRTRAHQLVRNGRRPTRFDRVLPADVVDQVWAPLRRAHTTNDVDAAFGRVAKALGEPRGKGRFFTVDEVKATGKKRWRTLSAPTPQTGYDLRLTDHYAPLIAHAIGGMWSTEVLQVAAETRTTTLLPAPDVGPLSKILHNLWVDSWITGLHAARQQVDTVRKAAEDGLDTGINWASWEPGNIDAAAIVANGGLEVALAEANVTIRGVAEKTIERLGSVLSDSLLSGSSVDSTARLIRDVLGFDLDRAELIAHTEIARFQTLGSLDLYAGEGIRLWDWIISDGACPRCVTGAAAGPYPVNNQGLIPAHPRCRCSAAPVPESVQ